MSTRARLAIVASTALAAVAAASDLRAQATPASAREPLPDCEWCGTAEAPAELDGRVTVAPESEPGERLVVRGTVYEPDRTTPAAGVVLYVYHTNAGGVYPRRGDETGNGRRHGYLRGWLRTDESGRYEIRTIRPGSYPGRDEPAHIHVTVQEPDGTPEYWLDSFLFASDPKLEPDDRGPHVLELRQDANGVWHGERDIVLPERP